MKSRDKTKRCPHLKHLTEARQSLSMNAEKGHQNMASPSAMVIDIGNWRFQWDLLKVKKTIYDCNSKSISLLKTPLLVQLCDNVTFLERNFKRSTKIFTWSAPKQSPNDHRSITDDLPKHFFIGTERSSQLLLSCVLLISTKYGCFYPVFSYYSIHFRRFRK